jgi:orotate phosphoribosyltransferase-like protein
MIVSSPPSLGTWMSDRFGVALHSVSSPVGLAIDDLVGVAARRNPRRAHLLVSSVLGKHIPVDPAVVVGTGRLLGELVADRLGVVGKRLDWTGLVRSALRAGDAGPLLQALDDELSDRSESAVLVLGFAETATGVGHLVADQLRATCYLHSTRRPVAGVEVAGTFEEGHSHATSHLLLPIPTHLLDDGAVLVLVDDELSTGRTAMGTIEQAHARRPRRHYVLASLIDLRSAEDEADMDALARRLGARIDVVSLVRGSVDLPAGLTATVAAQLDELGGDPAGDTSPANVAATDPDATCVLEIHWPVDVPDGGRHGHLTIDRDRFDRAVQVAGPVMDDAVDRALAGAAGRSVTVVGTEELMYLPLRLAFQLGRRPDLDVRFQSTTRSPVLVIQDNGYPVRGRFRFADPEGDPHVPRFLYNVHPLGAQDGPADLVVLVTDEAADSAVLRGADGPIAALQATGLRVLLVVVGACDPVALAVARARRPLPEPLVGPTFGSYAPDEAKWLLTDLSELDLEGEVADREASIQAGTAHYAESLPVEFQPDQAYQDLFNAVLANTAERLARAVGLVTELVLAERGHDVVLASLARAGTPIGILMRRWANFRHDLTLPHYALSIVRGRGIDPIALKYLAAKHDSRQVVFVDGWTGKGAIAKELTAALEQMRQEHGLDFNDDLAVLADPGHCVRSFGTRDDFLIASACLNSTVSGLVSRTVLNDSFLQPGEFHGAKFYSELAGGDVSNVLLDTVAAAFPAVVGQVLAELPALTRSDREPTFAGWRAIEAIRAEYGIESVNFVKPGVGETTRVLLRRVPWRILVREADNPDHAHLRLLAQQRDVPVEVRPNLPYSCVGLIRRISPAEQGEG